MLCPPEYMVCFLHRLIAALRFFWDGHKAKTPAALSSEGEAWGRGFAGFSVVRTRFASWQCFPGCWKFYVSNECLSLGSHPGKFLCAGLFQLTSRSETCRRTPVLCYSPVCSGAESTTDCGSVEGLSDPLVRVSGKIFF